ncbi:MAG TPA: helix-turn-helix transcriptional regulator [Symbiobacteriaceae bacterium]|nr:helix-turn-helix transcriptional regulator [Symbiobacteriaceae bacterium]
MKAGLVLAGLFGWLLAFPMFGPLLFGAAGAAAPTAGLCFVFAHALGLLLLHWLPGAAAGRRWLVPGAGALVAGLTLSFGLWQVTAPFAYVALAVIGLGAAVLVLAWVDLWMACAERLTPLAVAMSGANLAVALVALPTGLPPVVWLAPAAALALGSSIAIVRQSAPPAPAEAPHTAAPRGIIIATAAFAVADYFVGGIWYNIVAASAPAARAWQPSLEAVTYATAILLLYWLVRGRNRGQLALYSLSALGMGLVMAASGIAGAPFRAVLLLGLAAGDLFFWDQLGRLSPAFGARRGLGLGLGASVLLIGLANLGAAVAAPGQGGSGRLFLLIGAGLLFLVIPVVFRYAVGNDTAPPAEIPPGPALVVSGLTPTELQVYQLLAAGATDQEIAERLYVSKHTVKFHVRNVLHKAGVANRKQLLSRLVAATEEKRRP